MQLLFQYMDSIFPISLEIKEALTQNLKKKYLKRNQFILQEGQTCKHLYFIESGLLRCFYTQGSKEVSTWFMKEADMVISVQSFFNQKPSNESIQIL